MGSSRTTHPEAQSVSATHAQPAPPDKKLEAREHEAEIASLKAEIANYRTAFGNISQGVCLFDGARKLVFCNDRYAQLYRLTAEQVRPGTPLQAIIEARCAVGTSPVSAEEYLRLGEEINASGPPTSRLTELPDGRLIYISNQGMPGGGWVSTHEDVTEVTTARALASERISLQLLIDLVPDYLWVKDVEGRFVVVNRALAIDTRYAHTSDMIGTSDVQLHAPEIAQEFRAIEAEIMRSGIPMVDREELVTDAAGAKKWISSTKVPLRDDRNEVIGLVGIARDITARKLASVLQAGQIRILEQIVADAPLEDVLDQVVLLAESQSTGLFCSLLLLDADGVTLRRGAAPSVSEPFLGSAKGIRVGPYNASCGAAAHRREMVVVSDILSDPLWNEYRSVASAHGFRSCWSTPIISRKGDVLGTFAMYSRSVREPVKAEYQLIEFAARLAEIAIERARATAA
ncbi:PAS-domain containing protein [Pleomorphomonas sp. JP5]|uniref:PAS-domain containing protein n=1 Tax=Pleomorphomonas sp. JP5 TaxID=2942998 RepID=UPI0020435A13|nr:PAS-domain containing protein [Pleomorphomonas sp. JP5]MCM5557798.1 PAS-domain containing protein [Pleomorphomonas sp. JP5]